MPLKLGPELEVLIDDLQCLLVVLGQFDLLPELVRQVRPLNGLHVEVAVALVLENSRIPRVRKRARVPVAHARQVVLVPAEGLGYSSKSCIKARINYLALKAQCPWLMTRQTTSS